MQIVNDGNCAPVVYDVLNDDDLLHEIASNGGSAAQNMLTVSKRFQCIAQPCFDLYRARVLESIADKIMSGKFGSFNPDTIAKAETCIAQYKKATDSAAKLECTRQSLMALFSEHAASSMLCINLHLNLHCDIPLLGRICKASPRLFNCFSSIRDNAEGRCSIEFLNSYLSLVASNTVAQTYLDLNYELPSSKINFQPLTKAISSGAFLSEFKIACTDWQPEHLELILQAIKENAKIRKIRLSVYSPPNSFKEPTFSDNCKSLIETLLSAVGFRAIDHRPATYCFSLPA